MIKIYTRDNCPWCVKAKELMHSLGLEYKEFKLGIDYSRDDLNQLIPADRPLTVPQIFFHNQYIGGYTDFAEYVEDHGIMGLQT